MMRYLAVVGTSLLLGGAVGAHTVSGVTATTTELRPSCELAPSDSAWIAAALSGWERLNARSLHLSRIRYPRLVLFDSLCTHELAPVSRRATGVGLVAGRQSFTVRKAAHGEMIRLPNGDSVPAGLVSVASPLPNGGMFFVMSLPALWQSRARGERRDLLASAVFMHEYTHTQSGALGSRVDALVNHGLPADVDDDVIQSRFDSVPGFRTAYETERDLLFAAAAAPDRETAANIARRALASIDQRRARFFSGSTARYAEAEDVFLTMEGTGQWAAYLWLTDPEGGAMRPDVALPFIRRDGRHWSQDEGLALLLVLNRLDPSAPSALVGPRAATVLERLRKVLARR